MAPSQFKNAICSQTYQIGQQALADYRQFYKISQVAGSGCGQFSRLQTYEHLYDAADRVIDFLFGGWHTQAES